MLPCYAGWFFFWDAGLERESSIGQIQHRTREAEEQRV